MKPREEEWGEMEKKATARGGEQKMQTAKENESFFQVFFRACVCTNVRDLESPNPKFDPKESIYLSVSQSPFRQRQLDVDAL